MLADVSFSLKYYDATGNLATPALLDSESFPTSSAHRS